MTKNEKAVREVYPKATIESQRTNGGSRYYLVRKDRGAYMWLGSGDTTAQAWASAAAAVARYADTPDQPVEAP